MNNTKIEWCDSTWNPVTGCWHECKYCYAKFIAHRFGGCMLDPMKADCQTKEIDHKLYPISEVSRKMLRKDKNGNTVIAPYPFGFVPTFHRYRIDEPQKWKKPHTIFVCSMADLFGEWVPDEWIESVFEACKKAPQHRYLFLTKNPGRYVSLAYKNKLPNDRNMWYGTTMTDGDHGYFAGLLEYNVFLSIEPLIEDIGAKFSPPPYTKWVIIGAESGNRKGKVIPQKRWIDNIIDSYNNKKPIFMKDSLIPIVGEENMRREFPWK